MDPIVLESDECHLLSHPIKGHRCLGVLYVLHVYVCFCVCCMYVCASDLVAVVSSAPPHDTLKDPVLPHTHRHMSQLALTLPSSHSNPYVGRQGPTLWV
jgi:hypothetical protein